MGLLDRVQKQQGPDPNAVPEGAFVPQAGVGAVRQAVAAGARARTPFEQQAERVKNRLQARLIENIDEGEDEDRAQRAERITEALNAVVAEMGLSLTRPEKARLLDSVLNDFLGLGRVKTRLGGHTINEPPIGVEKILPTRLILPILHSPEQAQASRNRVGCRVQHRFHQ